MNVVGYIRVSTDEQAEKNHSLPVQESRISDYCKNKGYILLEIFEDDSSGRKVETRTQFKAMLEFCKKKTNRVNAVIVQDLSRLARNLGDQISTITALGALQIQLVSLDEPFDDSAAGKASRNMVGLMSQFFSDSLSEKTKIRMAAAVKSGRFVWVAPVGYVNDLATKKIKVDGARAPLVRQGFEMLATGAYSADDVLRTLNSLGLTTRKGAPVPRQTWHKIIRNPLYAGWVKSGDLMEKGTHEAIISQKLFDDVQYVLSANGKKNSTRNTNRPDFPLRQFVRCAVCNHGLTGGIVKKGFGYYWCYWKTCRKTTVSAEHLEKSFIRLLSSMEPTIEFLKKLPEIVARQWEERKKRITTDQSTLNKRLADHERFNSQAIKQKISGELSNEDFRAFKKTNTEEIAKIKTELKSLESEISMMKELMAQAQADMVQLTSAWEKAELRGKQELQKAVFPDGLVYDMNMGFFNRKNKSLLDDLGEWLQQHGELSTDVEKFVVRFGVPDGI